MFFTRTHHYHCPIAKDDFKNRLIGKHVRIHNLDFEVMEKDHMLSIIPHAEQVDAIKTLPITHVEFKEGSGDHIKVIITSKMRKLDVGGPQIIVIFCAFLFAASIVLFLAGAERMLSYILLGTSVFIFTIFWVRLEMGYLDYVRKIRAYVMDKGKSVVVA